MRIVIVNPNTTATVTTMLVDEARRIASPGVEIDGVTAAFGVPVIETPAEAAVAGHAVVQAFAEVGPADAGIVGAYTDPGLPGARALMPYPVIGIGESSMFTACLLGRRFAVLTAGGGKTVPAIESQVREHGLGERFAGVRSVDASLLGVAENQAAFEDAFAATANAVVEIDGADAVILGGAVFVGMAARLRDRVPVPLIDPIRAAVAQAEALARSGAVPSRVRGHAHADGKASRGLAAPLADALRRPRRGD